MDAPPGTREGEGGYEDAPDPAGIGLRIAAGAIDFILAVLLFIIVASALGMLDFDPDDPAAALDRLDLNLLSTAILVLYHAVSEVPTGRTLGKWGIGLCVVGAGGGRLDPGAGVLRNLIRPIDYVFFWAPGLLAILLSRRNQRLGDMAAQTMVVRLDR